MEKKEKNKLTSKDFYIITLFVILLLLVIITATSKTAIGSFFTYIFAYAFGYFYPFILVLLAIFSLRLIIKRKPFPFKGYKSIYLGLIIIFISSLCFASFPLLTFNPNFNFSKLSYTYKDLMSSFARNPLTIHSFSSLSSLGGGYIGAFFVALFSSIWGAVGDAIFFSFILLIGIFLILYKPVTNIIKDIQKNKKKKTSYSSDYQKENDNKQDKFTSLNDYSSWDKDTTDNKKSDEVLTNDYYAVQGDLKSTSTFNQIEVKKDDEEKEKKEESQGGLKAANYISDNSNNDSYSFSSYSRKKDDFNEDSTSTNDNSNINDSSTYNDSSNYKSDNKPVNNYNDSFKDYDKEPSLRNVDLNSNFNNDTSNNDSISNDDETPSFEDDKPLLSKEDDERLSLQASDFYKKSQQDDLYTYEMPITEKEAEEEVKKESNNYNDYNTFQSTSFNPLEEQAKRASKQTRKSSLTINIMEDNGDDEDEQVLSEAEQEAIIAEEYFKKKREEEEKIKREKEEKKQKELNEVLKFVSPVDRNYTYPLPDDSLLDDIDDSNKIEENKLAAEEKGRIINQVFEDFKIKAVVKSSTIGSSVTRFNVELDKGVRSDKLTSIVSELQRALKGDKSVRIETVVEGQDMPGIEIGNAKPMAVSFKEIFTTIEQNTKDNLLIPIGKDISGNIITYPLDKMPHLLVAGTTGSGKSVLVHSIIMTLLMRNYPSRLKLMLIDPKQVEFAKYNMEPHLFCPVISDAEAAITGLVKLCDEMDRRYSILRKYAVVKMDEYREKKQLTHDPDMIDLPDIVCIIDEFADLMQTSDGAVAEYVQRLTQKARAAGIYLIVATQRPEKNVIPGVIKSNIPCRIGLSCSTVIDSRVILDEPGAETLLGKGDLLFKSTTNRNLIRAQSPFISNNDINQVLEYLKQKAGAPNYSPDFLDLKGDIEEDENSSYANASEENYEKVKDFVISTGICSKSTIMKNFLLSYNKADQILTRLKQEGILMTVQGNKLKVVQHKDY